MGRPFKSCPLVRLFYLNTRPHGSTSHLKGICFFFLLSWGSWKHVCVKKIGFERKRLYITSMLECWRHDSGRMPCGTWQECALWLNIPVSHPAVRKLLATRDSGLTVDLLTRWTCLFENSIPPPGLLWEALYTLTHICTQLPSAPPHADHWPNRPTCFPAAASFSLNQVHRLPLFWLVALYLWINGERYLSPPQLSVQTTGAVSSLVVWTSLRCLFSFHNGDAICHLTFHKYFIVIIWQNHRTRAAESQRPQWQQEVLHQ